MSEKKPERMSRRTAIQTVGGVALGLAVGAAAGWLGKPTPSSQMVTATETSTVTMTATEATQATGALPNPIGIYVPTRAYAGETIRVSTFSGWSSYKPAQDIIGEFEDATGITVIHDEAPQADMPAKQTAELEAHSGLYDAITVSETGVFHQYVDPLNDRIAKLWGSVEAFEAEVFPIQACCKFDGQHYFYMHHGNVQVGFYRKQLFEDPTEMKDFEAQYGYPLAPPQTMSQLHDIATFFNRPPKLYGMTLPLGPIFGFLIWVDRQMDAGIDILDAKFRPIWESDPQAKDMLLNIAQWTQDVVHKYKYCNPDAPTWQLGDAAEFFVGGNAAMTYSFMGDYWKDMNSPDTKAKIGEIGSFVFPSFKEGVHAGGRGSMWAKGIPKDSKHKDAAWEYMKWLCSERPQMAMAGSQVPPFRTLAEKAATETFPGTNITLIAPALAESCLPARRWEYIAAAGNRFVGELGGDPTNIGQTTMYPQVTQMLITPEQWLEQFGKLITDTLDAAGYYK